MSISATSKEVDTFLEDEALAEEDLLDELEKEEIPAHIREARLQHFKEQARVMSDMKNKQYGTYTELTEAKYFLDLTTSEEKCIVHFFHTDFRRCSIMDTHLEKLAAKYFDIKFAKINVEKSKFFVDKLKIRVLPAVLCFSKGVVVDRVVGFEELGNTDSFSTDLLEMRLGKSGVIAVKGADKGSNTSILGRPTKKQEDSDSDNDW